MVVQLGSPHGPETVSYYSWEFQKVFLGLMAIPSPDTLGCKYELGRDEPWLTMLI